jgi:GTPase SAR1 family protein
MIIVERILKFENLKIKQINKNKNKENNVQRIVNSKIYISDHLVKLVVVGNSGVGKSSLMVRFSDDQFNDSYRTTIGVDFRFKTLDMEGESVKIQIWDTAGQERFRTITNAYYKGADGIIMVYDKNDLQSFDDINTYWINEVEKLHTFTYLFHSIYFIKLL